MNHKIKVTLGMIVIFTTLVVTGCATSQPTVCPTSALAACSTSAPAACPTSAPAACPTASVQLQPTMDPWRISYNTQHANIRITFDPGKKCSMDILKPASEGQLVYEIVVNDDEYRNYMVGTMTMDEGKTIQDLENYSQEHKGKVLPPSFTKLQSLEIISPMSRTWHAVNMPVSPIYIECFIEGPEPQTGFQVFGPVVVIQY
jgi:hypothetical protein